MKCMVPFLLFCLTTLELVSGISVDPKIYRPTNNSVWIVGQKYLINWNSTFRLPDGLYYNNYTRITIELFRQQILFKDQMLERIADNYPLNFGQLFYTVPSVFLTPAGREIYRVQDTESPSFYIRIYPSFFNWDMRYEKDLYSHPTSHLFVIKSNDTCAEDSCATVAATFDERQSVDYTSSLVSVAVGVGITALIALTIGFFIYSKQGKQNWKAYQRRKSFKDTFKPSVPSLYSRSSIREANLNDDKITLSRSSTVTEVDVGNIQIVEEATALRWSPTSGYPSLEVIENNKDITVEEKSQTNSERIQKNILPLPVSTYSLSSSVSIPDCPMPTCRPPEPPINQMDAIVISESFGMELRKNTLDSELEVGDVSNIQAFDLETETLSPVLSGLKDITDLEHNIHDKH